MTISEYKNQNLNFQMKRKYRNQPVIVDGLKFPSKKEAARYGKLKLLKRSGHVVDFTMQVPYRLEVNRQLICKYIADFVVTWPSGAITVEDTKGFRTPEYKLKRKLMLACHGITIKEL